MKLKIVYLRKNVGTQTSRLCLWSRYRTLTIWSTIADSELVIKSASGKPTRIQVQNESRIVAAALDVFSSCGYRGSTVDQIARNAGMSKANVLYYFNTKDEIYAAVLNRTLSIWLDPLEQLDPTGDPIEQLWNYARQKLQLSRTAPHASRLFANEILQGANAVRPFLETGLKRLVDSRCQIIQAWIDDGKIASVSPLHLLFLIWSSTQHYADFQAQINALYEGDERALFDEAERTLRLIITQGLRPTQPE
ncbi:MAG: TetR family transcriptional regulator C-terminal domain-containing protein [Granulosicoccus sp.]